MHKVRRTGCIFGHSPCLTFDQGEKQLKSRVEFRIAKQADGFTYERRTIEQWLETHSTSPTTGAELVSKQLYPCPRGRQRHWPCPDRGDRSGAELKNGVLRRGDV